MKKLLIIAAITVLFSTMASANSGLADRINDARTYPNKMVDDKKMETCAEHMKKHEKRSQDGMQNDGRPARDMEHS